jgi:hypothetical protein
MKIYNKIGSKERLFEMFQNVNKININEGFYGDDENQNNSELVIIENAFNNLAQGKFNLTRNNTQSQGDETFTELIGNDAEGNQITFRFKTMSSENDQDGVFSLNDAVLIGFKSNNLDLSEGSDILNQFNEKYSSEIVSVISQYVDISTEEPELDEAIKLIDAIKQDSYPFGGGTDKMQTGKAYGDEKPTNPKVRVKAPELDKFVQESAEHERYSTYYQDILVRLKAFAEENGFDPIQLKNDLMQEADPYNMKTPKDRIDIFFEIVNEILEANEPNENIQEDSDDMQFDDEMPPSDLDAEDTLSYRERMGIEEPEPEIEAESISQEKENRILQAYDNLMNKNSRNPNYSPTGDDIRNEINRLEGRVKPMKKNRSVSQEAEPYLSEEEASYPEPMGKEFSPKKKYPFGKKKYHTKKVKLSEEDDNISFDPEDDEIEQLSLDKEESGEELQGGEGDDKSPMDFDPNQILMGLKVEMEHSDDPMQALEITMDHLSEDPEYYTVKDDPEDSAQFNAASDAEEMTSTDEKNPSGCFDDRKLMNYSDDEETTNMLLGFKPKNVGDEIDGEEIVDESDVTYDDL